MYLTLIELGIQFLLPFLSGLKGGKAPAEVLQAVQAAIDAIINHKQDIINRVNLESMRG
jgi:hypothetical protein